MTRKLTGVLLGVLVLFAFTASASTLCSGVGSVVGTSVFSASSTYTSGTGTSSFLSGTTATLSCGAFTVDNGYTLTGVVIALVNDGSSPATPSSTAVVTWNSVAGSTNVTFATETVTLSSDNGGFTYDLCGGSPVAAACPVVYSFTENVAQNLVFPAFSVTASASPAGAVSGDGNVNARLYVTYTETLNQTGVPEPATMGLLGAGLVGLAMIARKRRS